MSKSILKSLNYLILLFLAVNCNSVQPTDDFPKPSGKIFNENQHPIQTTDLIPPIDVRSENKPEKKLDDKVKTSDRKVLIDVELWNEFFKGLKNIPPKKAKRGLGRITSRFQRHTWIAEWNKVVKKLKKTSPSIEQTSLQIVRCIMELSDKNPEKSKKSSAEKIITQFNEDIKKILKEQKTKLLRATVLISIQEVNNSLTVASKGCKKEIEKERLRRVSKALDLFEETLDT